MGRAGLGLPRRRAGGPAGPRGGREQLARTKRALREVRAEPGTLRDELAGLKEKAKKPPDPGALEGAVGQALDRDRQVLKLRAEAAELEKTLASGSWDKTVRLWGVANGKSRKTEPAP